MTGPAARFGARLARWAPRSIVGRASLLTALYVLSGKLGLLFAIPPGYSTLIWPPSGVAVGFLLVYGWRVWPGVLAGAFILNAFPAALAEHGVDSQKIWLALAIAAGSALQALAARALVVRFGRLPLSFSSAAALVKVFALAGPAACTVAASVGIAALFMAGSVAPARVVDNWLIWWGGDFFGVIVFMPIVLAAAGAPHRMIWRGKPLGRRPLLVMLALLIPLTITLEAWKVTTARLAAANASAFEHLALESENALARRMSSSQQALRSAAAFFVSSKGVTRDDWRDYVETAAIGEASPGIGGLGYVEPRNDGAAYVVKYIEPEGQYRWALGVDLAAEPLRQEAAQLARDTGKPAITLRLPLIGGSKPTSGFLLLHPIYASGSTASTGAERGETFRGWIYAPVAASTFLNGLTRSQGTLLDIAVYDGREQTPDALIYSSTARGSTQGLFTVSKPLTILNRTWLVTWTSTPDFDASHQGGEASMVLIGGLALSALLAMLVLISTARSLESLQWMATEKGYLVPLVAFVIVTAASVYRYQVLTQNEARTIQGIVGERAERTRSLMDAELASRITSFKRMAQRWEAAGRTPEDQWRKDATSYLNYRPGLHSLHWIDATDRIRWSEPAGSRDLPVLLSHHEGREEMLTEARNRRVVVLSPPYDLDADGRGFIVYAPLERQNEPDGFIAALFNAREFFLGVSTSEFLRDFAVTVRAGGAIVWENRLPDAPLDERYSYAGVLDRAGENWTVSVKATSAFAAASATWLPVMSLGTGLLVATLLALTLRAMMVARLRSAYLAKSSELNSAIMSSAASLMIATDRDGLVTSFNRAAEIALGYSAREILGRETPAIWHDLKEIARRSVDLTKELGTRVEPGFDAFVAKARQTGVDDGEWTFVRRNGSRFPGHLTVTTLRNAIGEVTGYLGIIEDVTARREAEEALRTSEETFRSAMQSASIGMALVTPAGKWLKVNSALCTLLGYTEQELLERDFQSLTHPDDLEADVRLARDALAGQIDRYRMEKRYLHKSGRIVVGLLSVSLVRDGAGRPNYFVSQIQDITEQKEMERLKNEFVSVISHELRTPLTAIRGSLGLTLGPLADQLTAQTKRLLTIADNNSERLILLINDILDVDKIASGRMRFDMKEHSLASITRRSVDAMHPYAQKFDVHIDLAPVDPDIRISVDEDRFIQVLSNLLSNAAKFSPQHAAVRVFTQLTPGWVRLNVEDSGVGIPNSFRERIFEKFSQADASAARRASGTGLGLNIARQMVERMNGRIGFDSVEGSGSTFWVDFPVCR